MYVSLIFGCSSLYAQPPNQHFHLPVAYLTLALMAVTASYMEMYQHNRVYPKLYKKYIFQFSTGRIINKPDLTC